jgi:hypothetical protein
MSRLHGLERQTNRRRRAMIRALMAPTFPSVSEIHPPPAGAFAREARTIRQHRLTRPGPPGTGVGGMLRGVRRRRWGTGISVVLATTAAGATASGWVTGCTDDAAGDADVAEAGMPDASRPRTVPPVADAANPTCEQACEQDHPKGLVEDRALLSCWEAHCRTSCITPITQTADAGDAGDAGDGGAVGDAGSSCTTDVVTERSACDDCTRSHCCAVWDTCFQDPDCVALNACYQTCTE